MSEEEKKAIEYLKGKEISIEFDWTPEQKKQFEDVTGFTEFREDTVKCEILLKLLEKQQKEIEQLKEKNETLTDITFLYNTYVADNDNKIIIADKRYFDNGVFVKKYISKDKIIDLSSNLEAEIDFDGTLTKLDSYCLLRAIINKLDELMEE